MEKKMFVFDIDGTLLDSNKKLPRSTQKSVAALKAQGHHVLIATGRTKILAQDIIDRLHLEDYILCNGAAGFLNHKMVFKNILDRDSLREYAKRCDEHNVGLIYETMDEIRAHDLAQYQKVRRAMKSIESKVPELAAGFSQTHEIFQALSFHEEDQDAVMEAGMSEFRFVRWHQFACDVLPKDGSKAVTILKLAKQLGMGAEDIITFGDGNNDVEMLEAAGVGVAMGNASDFVKSHANQITDTCDHDGIYKALKKLEYVSF